MNKKILVGGLMSFIFVIAFLSIASATITFTDSVTEITLDKNDLSKTFTLTTNVLVDFSIATASQIIIKDSGDHEITLTFSDNGSTATQVIEYTVNASGDLDLFNFPEIASTNVDFYVENSSENQTKTISFKFENTDFCEDCDNKGYLDLRIEDINVIEGFGDDDEYWYLFDVIEVELEIENEGNWDVDDIEVEWALYTTDGKKIMDDTLNDFNLKDGKDETKIFTIIFDEDIEDFETEDAVLYIKAKGQIDDSGSLYDGEDTCDSESVEIDVRADEDFVILTDFEINSVKLEGNSNGDYMLEDGSLFCGQEVVLTAEIWNIGDNDQDDVYVDIFNKELDTIERIDVGDIDAFEDEDLSLTFTLSDDLEERWYTIEFRVYDDSDDIYENSEDDLAKFKAIFKVENCKNVVAPEISAQLDSEAVEGRDLIIKAIITNPSDKEIVYSLNAAGFSEWADLKSISADTFKLEGGESVEVYLTFDTKKDSAGEKIFTLEVISENELVASQPIGVSIKEGGTSFTEFVKDNWKLAGIILLNLILVIAIIIVAVRIYRR